MNMTSKNTAPTKLLVYGKFAFALLLALTFSVVHPGSTAAAKKRKAAKYGSIKIRTSPAGLPLEFDGKASGVTTADDREFDKLEPGVHTIVISLPDGQRWTRDVVVDAGRIKCVALNYRPAPPPPAKSPCPYPVIVSAPATVNESEVITFTADISYTGTAPLNYTWTVTPANARILSGVGTPTITIDSTGLAGQRITATLVVDDGSGEAACRQVAEASTTVPPPPPPPVNREFDVCCSCSYDDQKARLDNLAIELQNDPTTTTYIIAYAGRTSRVGQADRLSGRSREYLVTQRGIDQSRIIVMNGGFREEDCVELWIVPSGATAPQPTPTVQPGDARPARGTPARRRRD